MYQTENSSFLLPSESLGVRAVVSKQVERAMSRATPYEFPRSRFCPKGLSILLAERSPAVRPISEWMSGHHATLMVIEDKPVSLDWLRRLAPRLDFLIVDADYMDDIEETVDFCMRVRRATPSLPLILLSSEVRGHDLTCERMAACDVTLKTPVQGQMLTEGIKAAVVNNAYFRSSGS